MRGLTELDLRRLPRWALVAFAARCARTINDARGDLDQDRQAALEAILVAERAAATGTALDVTDAIRTAKEAANKARVGDDSDWDREFAAPATAAALAARMVRDPDPENVRLIIEDVDYYCGGGDTADKVRADILEDYRTLVEAASEQCWDDNTPINERFFTRAPRSYLQHVQEQQASDAVNSPLRRSIAVGANQNIGGFKDVGGTGVYDAFISHASEDKDTIVRDLAKALLERGCKVWYDEFELTVGDSLRQSIDRGLVQSRYGIVILSKEFFGKNWPAYELNGLLAREVAGAKVILPIWHGIEKSDLLRYSPSLADKFALKSASGNVHRLADQLAELIRPRTKRVLQ
jgi:hypothetical protein